MKCFLKKAFGFAIFAFLSISLFENFPESVLFKNNLKFNNKMFWGTNFKKHKLNFGTDLPTRKKQL